MARDPILPAAKDSESPQTTPRTMSVPRGAICKKLEAPPSQTGTFEQHKVEAPSQLGGSFEQHYKLRDKVLGTGVCGAVREALCRRTGRVFAVKSFEKDAMTPKTLASMRSELEVHAGLTHDSIVKVEAVYETDTLVHLVMERLEGGELFARILEWDRLCETEAGLVVTQLLQVLEYLHSQRICHRDIKPENVLFRKRGGSDVALIDFGFSTRVAPGAKLSQRCGSLQYVAPEVLAGREYDEKADMWSLGSVLYSMLTGEVLFDGKTKEQVFKQNVFGRFAPSRRFRCLPADAREFIRQLLASDPAARPSASEALAHPWLQSVMSGKRGAVSLSSFDMDSLLCSAWRLIGTLCS